VVNYLNKFGRTGKPGRYKIFDPISELHYEALRYMQGLPPSPAAISNLTSQMYDGFPIYTDWSAHDPYANRPAILELLQQQERYMTQNNRYLEFSNNNGTTNPTNVPFKTFAGDSPTGTAYQLSAARCSNDLELTECVKITATPTLTDAEVGSLWAMSTGARNCSGTASTTPPAAPPKVCWP
jgi:type IV pilus assembly protein PilE